MEFEELFPLGFSCLNGIHLLALATAQLPPSGSNEWQISLRKQEQDGVVREDIWQQPARRWQATDPAPHCAVFQQTEWEVYGIFAKPEIIGPYHAPAIHSR